MKTGRKTAGTEPAKRHNTGNYGALIRLGAPVLVTQLGIIVVSFADTMMVGAYGLNELGAAAFVNSFFMVAFVMLIGFANGVTPLVGALYGRGRKFAAGQLFRSAAGVNAAAGAAATAVMAAFIPILHLMNQPPELEPLIREYYLFVLAGLFPTAIFNCFQQMDNGVTDTATPMWIMLGANALNIFGNWVFIFGNLGMPELGLAGAGLSTLAARWSGAIAIMLVFRYRRAYRPYLRGTLARAPKGYDPFSGMAESGKAGKPVSAGRRVWTTSYPVMIQSGVECFLWSFGAIVCGWFGTVQLASYQVVMTISQLGFMIFMSVGVAIAVRVANFAGTGDRTAMRATARAGLHLNLILATLAMIAFYFFGPLMLEGFTDSAEVVATGTLLIPPLMLYQYGDAIQLSYANALRGTSHVAPMLWISIISYLVVGVPALLFFAETLGGKNVGVYYSFSAALFTAAILYYTAFRKVVKTQ